MLGKGQKREKVPQDLACTPFQTGLTPKSVHEDLWVSPSWGLSSSTWAGGVGPKALFQPFLLGSLNPRSLLPSLGVGAVSCSLCAVGVGGWAR